MELEELLSVGWKEVVTASKQRKHSFHTATYATLSAFGPESRTVTLRHASELEEGGWELGFNADIRSPKALQSKNDAPVTWLFYSFPHKLQVRVWGYSRVHYQDELAESIWNDMQLLSRRCYLAPLAPSFEVSEATSNIPELLRDREPIEEESVPGYQNFCVVRTRVSQIEVLKLEFEGAWRAKYTPDSATWLAP